MKQATKFTIRAVPEFVNRFIHVLKDFEMMSSQVSCDYVFLAIQALGPPQLSAVLEAQQTQLRSDDRCHASDVCPQPALALGAGYSKN